ncbi:universal stress protein [Methylobacterium aerolatum]|uniref:Nucleotide-binding universal stress UspA family protein n=1 Tax=Methylobacterium aerolatum TaxID=418708 RepID=A0ABU0HUJ9_9HYPH|nr:universal stress protein [Methylobacterium aerolatum]MDQ0445995.1 nucleotide-binding universal stress UspA family protein [Methylobacterium aerolatum]GJD35032.1 hypothetical protein FMGBMHLM_1939 [Methylobacterium aerolatum]
MGYGTILVTVDTEEGAHGRVRIAGHLADAFGSGLLGVSARMPPCIQPAGGPVVDARTLTLLQESCLLGLADAHALFEVAAAEWSSREWASDIDDPLSFVMRQAARAGLVVTGRPDPGGLRHLSAHPGDLVMDLGRPLMVVPPRVDHLDARRVAVAWRDTREARRAVTDAMPFLKRAAKVVVCTIEEGRPRDPTPLIRYLAAHDVEAVAATRPPEGASTAEALIELACDEAADLLVAGAYGHSRLREWAFGGVTRDLLNACPICCLLSH